jgi:hypothetical protein
VRRGASTGVGGATAAIGMYTFPLSHAHPPPSMLHVACPCWCCSARYVVKLQRSPAPSRVRNPHAMRVGVVVARAAPMVFAWVWLCIPCCRCAPLSLASNKDVGLRTPVCRVLVVSRCVRDACRCVAECRSGGLGSGRKPVVSVCVKRVSSSWGSMPRFGPVLR